MTNGKQSDERAIFLAALEQTAPQAREAYVQGACAGNPDLLRRLRDLLAAHEASQGPFDAPPPGLGESRTIDTPRLERPGMQIGPYKLLQQIGEGGMGVVYMAEQHEPVRRKVALKIIKPGMDSRQVIARFEAERQALSLMDHPNIARVLDAGTTDGGRPYFVMELVRGQPITEYCDEHHLTPRQRLEMLLPVCQAIQHAHQKGIIHRDIKPSNVLVAEYDQQAVPKVIDFGVAKATSHSLTERTMFTGFGQVVGTLEYMSPEQAKVNQLDIDTRSDIYSLGVLLYELLTGTTPFDKQRLRSAAWDEMLRIIREEEPPKPSTRLSTIDTLPSVAANRRTEPGKLSGILRGELDWIVMKALDKDRNRRYETANGLAMDLLRYLHDEPVVACPPSATYRFRKFARRNRAALSTAALLASALLLGTTISIWQAIRATTAEREASQALVSEQVAHREADQARIKEAEQRLTAEHAREDEAKQRQAAVEAQTIANTQRQAAETAQQQTEMERQRAEENFEKARRFSLESQHRLVRLYVRRGAELVDQADFTSALTWFIKALEIDHADARQEAIHRLRIATTLDRCPKLTQVWYPEHEVETIQVYPNGNWALLYGQSKATVWDIQSGTTAGPTLGGYFCQLSPDGSQIVELDEPGIARLLDSNSGRVIVEFPRVQARPWNAGFSRDGRRLYVIHAPKSVQVWDATNGKAITPLLNLAGESIAAARLSPSGRYLVAAVHGHRPDLAVVYDTDSSELIASVPLDEGLQGAQWRDAIAVTDERFAVIVDCFAQVVGLMDGKLAYPRPRNSDKVNGLVLSPDQNKLVTWGLATQARLWNAQTGEELTSPLPGNSPLAIARFSPDGSRLVTGFRDGEIRVWNVSDGSPALPLLRHPDSVSCAEFDLQGRRLMTASLAGGVRVWDLASARTAPEWTRRYNSHGAPQVTFSLDERRMFVAGFGDAVIVHDLSTRQLAMQPLRHSSQAKFGGPSPDGTRLVTAGVDGTIAVRDAANGESVFEYTGCRTLPSGHPEEEVHFTRRNEPFSAALSGASFSPNGRHVLGYTACFPRGYPKRSKVVVLDAATGHPAVGPLELRSNIMTQTVTADGRYWIIGLSDAYSVGPTTCVEIRSLPDLALVRQMPLKLIPRAVQTSRDGKRLLVGTGDTTGVGTAQVFDLDTLQAVTPEIRFRGMVERVQFLEEDRRFLTVSLDGVVRLWQSDTGQPSGPEIRAGRRITALAVHPDESWIATGTGTNNIRGVEAQYVRFWDLRTGEPISPPIAHGNRVLHLAFSSAGSRLSSTSRDFHLRVWKLPHEVRPFEDLRAVVQVTTGATLDAADNVTPLNGESFRKMWTGLREKYIEDFTATPDEERDWQRHQSEIAQSQKDQEAAVDYLTSLIELDGGDPELYLRRVRLNAQLGRWDSVPADVQTLTILQSRTGGELAELAELVASLRHVPTTLETYVMGIATKGVEQAPADSDTFIARSHIHALRGQWSEASRDLARAVELDSGNFRTWYELALTQLCSGDEAAFAETCRRMRHAIPASNTPLIERFVAWTAALNERGADDWSDVIARAQWALDRLPFDDGYLTSAGAVLYREGRLDEALRHLSEANRLLNEPSAQKSSSPAYTWLFLAMTYQQLGATDEARVWFDKAQQWKESQAAEAAVGDEFVAAWNREATLQLLCSEAERLINTDLSSCSDPQVWQARAKWREMQGDITGAEDAWLQVTKWAGDNPLPWIHRGRWYAEKGQQEKADADFAKAASLTPNELNKFLTAGWWVVGPYPAELKEFCPPEVDPDPARPVRVIDPQTGLSDQPVKWQSVPTTQWGRVDLTSLPGEKDKASMYALSHVYSPEERTVLLMIHKSRPLRLWVNGEFIEDYVPGEYPAQPYYEQFHRVPIVLHPGRNTILVKATTPDFYVRVGDTPRDRSILLAEQQRFAAAAQAFGQLPAADQLDLSGVLHPLLANVLALASDHQRYERFCAAVTAGSESQPASTKNAVAYFCAQTPNPVFDAHAEQLVSYAEEYAAANREPWALFWAALVNYRANHRERASSLLDEAKWNSQDRLLRALLAHHAGDAAAAQQFLDEGLAVATAYVESSQQHDRADFDAQPFVWWYDWATFLTLLTEAERAIRGETTQSVGLKQRYEAMMAQKWAESPETAAFDHAMLFASRDGAQQVKYGQPYLAHGKRLAELGRFGEAEADFSQAVELAPTDPDVLTQRALFFAERDDPQRAATDFNAALTLIEKQNPPRWLWGRTIDAEVARRESVYDALQALRPTDGQLLSIRIISRLRNGERESLAAPCRQLEQFGFQPYLAAVHLLRGDRVEFERLRATDAGDAYHRTLLCGLAPTDETIVPQLLAAAEELGRQGPHDRWQRRWIGLAQLRAGRLDEAKATLLGCLDSQSAWQVDSIVWPLLAITCHQLGETAESQRWWQKSEIWLRTLERLPPAEWSGAVVRGFSCEEWLMACVFHREAKALIEGAADPTQPLPASAPE